jgi:hypothetical protein
MHIKAPMRFASCSTVRSGIEEIVRADVDPNCHFFSEDGAGLSGPYNWDVAVHLYVHPQ